jgi:hypothetical protein
MRLWLPPCVPVTEARADEISDLSWFRLHTEIDVQPPEPQ